VLRYSKYSPSMECFPCIASIRYILAYKVYITTDSDQLRFPLLSGAVDIADTVIPNHQQRIVEKFK